MYKTLIIVLSIGFLVSSCQVGENAAPADDPLVGQLSTSTLETNALPNNDLKTPTVEPQPYSTYQFLSPVDLEGKLFLGSFHKGNYVMMDFNKKSISTLYLPQSCYFLVKHMESICEQRIDSISSMVYLLNHKNGEKDYFLGKYPSSWEIINDNTIIGYIEKGNGKTILKSYNIEKKEITEIYEYNLLNGRYLIPSVSNSLQDMIGIDYKDNQNDLDNTWYMVPVNGNDIYKTNIPEDIVALNEIVWAPNDRYVVLLGYNRNKKNPSKEIFPCGTTVILYNPHQETDTKMIDMPSGRCITPFSLYYNHLWSPDGTKLAIVLDERDICISDQADDFSKCLLIPGVERNDLFIANFAWSPKSDGILTINNQLEIDFLDLTNFKTTTIINLNGLPATGIYDVMEWRN